MGPLSARLASDSFARDNRRNGRLAGRWPITAGPAGNSCSANTIGHTGFTGTGLWIDFDRGFAWSLLTNRVHPTRHFDSGIVELRQSVGDLVVAGLGNC
jgi:CubicO group peptidase (beta-lactamase class C family)